MMQGRAARLWMLLLVGLCAVLAGCGGDVQTGDGADDGGKVLRLGESRTYWQDFVLTSEIKTWDQPDLFEEDGKYGFRLRKTGEIVVPAEYDAYHAFRNGYGAVRQKTDDGYDWQYVDIRGNVLDYDYIRGFYGLTSIVSKDDKYGVINTESQVIVPLIYDEMYHTGDYDADGRYISYVCAVRDGSWYWLDLQQGYEASFEPIVEGKEYDRMLDLDGLMLVNDMLLVDGVAQPNGSDFPICALQGLEFDLYDQNGNVGRCHGELISGAYEGELFVSFAEHPYSGYWGDEENCYFALPAGAADPFAAIELTAIEDDAACADAVNAYLAEQGVANTEVRYGGYIGDFAGDGKTGALIEISDVYRDDYVSWRKMMLEYTGSDMAYSREPVAKMQQDEIGFVNAILYIPDIAVPTGYRARLSEVWQHFDVDYMTGHIYFVADVDGDAVAECITDRHYYEYRDYGIAEIVEMAEVAE